MPGLHSTHYPGAMRVRQGTVGIVNPISVPGIWATGGIEVQNWSGSESASGALLARLVAGLGGSEAAPARLAALGLPAAVDLTAPGATGAAPLRRALLLDLRNLGTLGLQQDSFPALLWADALAGRARIAPEVWLSIPPMYATSPVRHVLDAEAALWAIAAGRGPSGKVEGAEASRGADVARATRNGGATAGAAAVARGRALFAERIVGTIANRRILSQVPPIYAAAHLGGPALAPIDEASPARLTVRCADCHNATPGGTKVSLDRASPPFGRCSHCHRSHLPFEPDDGAHEPSDPEHGGSIARLTLAALGVPAAAAAEVARCRQCHAEHPPFTPVVFSSSALLPFDANENGRAQDDERADGQAGGIGTEALLAFDVPRLQRPAGGFAVSVPRLSTVHAAGPVSTAHLGYGWVRVAPLVALRASAPYLHNGSVPTLWALLEPSARRPRSFALGRTGFVFDTRLPGNRNLGHEFGTRLSAAEKRDLIAFLSTL